MHFINRLMRIRRHSPRSHYQITQKRSTNPNYLPGNNNNNLFINLLFGLGGMGAGAFLKTLYDDWGNSLQGGQEPTDAKDLKKPSVETDPSSMAPPEACQANDLEKPESPNPARPNS